MTLGELAAVLLEAEKTGRPIQVNSLSNPPDGGWIDWDGRRFNLTMAYRVKPDPRKPREWWVNVYDHCRPCVHATRLDADVNAGFTRTECVHVREVLDE